MVGRGFFVVILVVSGSSTSSMFIFRGNSRTFRVAQVVGCGFFVVILVVSGSSTSSILIFCGNSRAFRVAQVVGRGFFVVILVASTSATSSVFIFRGTSRASRWSGMFPGEGPGCRQELAGKLKPCEFSRKVSFGQEVLHETLSFPEARSRCRAVLILVRWTGERFCVAGAGSFRGRCSTLSSSTSKFGQVRSVQEVSHETHVLPACCVEFTRSLRRNPCFGSFSCECCEIDVRCERCGEM